MYRLAYFHLIRHHGIPVVEIPPALEDVEVSTLEARMRAISGHGLEEVGAVGYVVVRACKIVKMAIRRRFGLREVRFI